MHAVNVDGLESHYMYCTSNTHNCVQWMTVQLGMFIGRTRFRRSKQCTGKSLPRDVPKN